MAYKATKPLPAGMLRSTLALVPQVAVRVWSRLTRDLLVGAPCKPIARVSALYVTLCTIRQKMNTINEVLQ